MVFAAAYITTRSPTPVGDASRFISVARSGDPAEFHYGEPSHFLQAPLVRLTWRSLHAVGLKPSVETVFVAVSLAGTLAAIVFIGLIAAERLRRQRAAWIASLLFGTSLHAWTQWNGELYGLALGFVSAALFLVMRGRLVPAGCVWALAVLSHSDFVLAAPAFLVAAGMTPAVQRLSGRLRRVALLASVAAPIVIVVLLAGSYAIGKWSDATSLAGWLRGSQQARATDVSAPQPFRAFKGLVTAYTVAGHHVRNILTGRAGYGNPRFVVAAAVGLLVLAATGVLLVAGVGQRELAFFALAWLLPFHVLFNWWFVPTVEKYHAGALPGFVLLITAGLERAGSRLQHRGRRLLYVGYIAVCASLNLFGAVLPMQAFGQDSERSRGAIRQLHAERAGKPVFLACDDPQPLVGAGVEFLRLRSFWRGSVPEVQRSVISWTQDRIREGKEPYLVGRWCSPEEWKNAFSTDPFDFYFLQQSFELVPTAIVRMPISASVPTDPFNWTRGDVVRLVPRNAAGDGSR